VIIHPMYGEDPNHGLTIVEQDEHSARFTLEAIREAPAEYGVGAALVLLKLPPPPLTVFVEWERTEDYYPDREGEGWRNLWLQFGASPDRQHPVFYVRPAGLLRYETGWNTGGGMEQQTILGDLDGSPVAGFAVSSGFYLGLREQGFGIGDWAGYCGGYRWDGVSQYGEIRPEWLGVYGEASLLDVKIRMEVREA